MTLKLFVAQCLPQSMVDLLRETGHEVLLFHNYLPFDSSDEAAIAKAQELEAILVSLNGDFADIVTYPPTKYSGIISIQLRNHPEIINVLMETLSKYFLCYYDMEHYKGKLLIVETDKIRVRQ